MILKSKKSIRLLSILIEEETKKRNIPSNWNNKSTSYHKLIEFLKIIIQRSRFFSPISRNHRKRFIIPLSIRSKSARWEDQTLPSLPFKTRNVTNISSPRERHLERNSLFPKNPHVARL